MGARSSGFGSRTSNAGFDRASFWEQSSREDKMRLRQIALVARDLRPVETAICEAFGLEVCFRDPGLAHFGLRHGLYPIGDHILEVVVPKQDGTTAGRFLDRRGGDGGYMVIVQVDDLEGERARLETSGIRVVFEAEGSGIRGIHLHPKDVGGAILSIDQADPRESWGWAGHDWPYHRRESVVNDLAAVELQAENPDAMAQRWSVALGKSVSDTRTIELSDASIRFVEASDGRGDGLAAADLVATDRNRAGESIELCGFRFNLV
jgi:hypothetical protein